MKFEHYSSYDARVSSHTIPALATIWPKLGDFYDDLVVVGGLVPHFICSHPASAPNPPVTLDVDLGISIHTSAGQYESVATRLRNAGFLQSGTETHRYQKLVGTSPLYVDFLTDYGSNRVGAVVVDDVTASCLPGIDRALVTAREINFKATDLYGATQPLRLRVCDAGAFLVLKLRAFLLRREPKDAFDILYTLQHYDKGREAAIKSFCVERDARNPAFLDAEKALKELYDNENSPGPFYAANFLTGGLGDTPSQTTREEHMAIRQNALVLAASLRRALD